MRRIPSDVSLSGHGDRIRRFADRVLSLEDGTFKETAGLVIDPVCGMQIDPTEARHQLTIDGHPLVLLQRLPERIPPPSRRPRAVA